MPTVLEQKQMLEKQLRELQTEEQKAATAKAEADAAFIRPIEKRLEADRLHTASVPEVCLIVRAVLAELGLYKPTKQKPAGESE